MKFALPRFTVKAINLILGVGIGIGVGFGGWGLRRVLGIGLGLGIGGLGLIGIGVWWFFGLDFCCFGWFFQEFGWNLLCFVGKRKGF